MLIIQNNFHYCQNSQESEQPKLSISAFDHLSFPKTLSNVCNNILISIILLIIISRYDPCKAHTWFKSHSVCQGKSYCHMLASQDITITKLTLQNKVGVKKQGKGNSNIKQHWWAYHHCATLQGDLCRLEIRLHQQTFHFKVWDERVPPLTFCSILAQV